MKKKKRDTERNMKKEETKETENEAKKNTSLHNFIPIFLFSPIHLPLFFVVF